ncbi:MAG: pilus assembly protein PilM [Candidatus Magasanikbacteria bacterium]|jgi:type IV pilus assembly protein PilM|nr:pilus assembly protein PilM [Candidatus Magasanikbacteria bacterium]MBT4071911.1 pilus assembly protein PilM [Candidatus Magasanikbacteria bacterium]
MLTNPFPQAFGIDINDFSIKLVQLKNTSFLKKSPQYSPVLVRSITLPKGLIVKGEIVQPEPVRKRLQTLLGQTKKYSKITSPWVVASVPEQRSFLKLTTIKKQVGDVSTADIKQMIAKHVPYEEETSYIDWQIMPQTENGHGTNVLISVADKMIVDSYTYLLESVGLVLIGTELESLALSRAMITAPKLYKNEARALLDIGADKTLLVIYDNDSVQFSIVLDYCGEGATQAVAKAINLEHKEAELLKHTVGIVYDKKYEKVWHALMQSTEQLFTEIERAFDFYTSHFPQANNITHITMSGGGSIMKGLGPLLTEKLGVEAAPGKPWKNLGSKKANQLSQKAGEKYARAIGLALRAADNPYFDFDTI